MQVHAVSESVAALLQGACYNPASVQLVAAGVRLFSRMTSFALGIRCPWRPTVEGIFGFIFFP
jgi:hypothetical protein